MRIIALLLIIIAAAAFFLFGRKSINEYAFNRICQNESGYSIKNTVEAEGFVTDQLWYGPLIDGRYAYYEVNFDARAPYGDPRPSKWLRYGKWYRLTVSDGNRETCVDNKGIQLFTAPDHSISEDRFIEIPHPPAIHIVPVELSNDDFVCANFLPIKEPLSRYEVRNLTVIDEWRFGARLITLMNRVIDRQTSEIISEYKKFQLSDGRSPTMTCELSDFPRTAHLDVIQNPNAP